MVKYLVKLINVLKLFISGMHSNAAVWAAQTETEVTVKAKVLLLEEKNTEIIDLKELLSVKYAEARTLKHGIDQYTDGMINLARGLHKDTPEKLIEYGIPPVKPRTPSKPPIKSLTAVLKDDTDGEGFIISLESVDENAENYEWEKGVSVSASDVQLIPAMSHFKLTTKMTFVDDDVVKGTRCWYRVRSINRKGVGPWSEPANRVQ